MSASRRQKETADGSYLSPTEKHPEISPVTKYAIFIPYWGQTCRWCQNFYPASAHECFADLFCRKYHEYDVTMKNVGKTCRTQTTTNVYIFHIFIFIYSFIHSFIYLFILFIYSFIFFFFFFFFFIFFFFFFFFFGGGCCLYISVYIYQPIATNHILQHCVHSTLFRPCRCIWCVWKFVSHLNENKQIFNKQIFVVSMSTVAVNFSHTEDMPFISPCTPQTSRISIT